MSSIKKLEVKVNDDLSFSICHESRIILFLDYENKCNMTINYSDNWSYSRALQHAISISECFINSSII